MESHANDSVRFVSRRKDLKHFLTWWLDFFKNGATSRALSILAFLAVVAAVPLTVYIAQQQQETRQRASENNLVGPPITTTSSLSHEATTRSFQIPSDNIVPGVFRLEGDLTFGDYGAGSTGWAVIQLDIYNPSDPTHCPPPNNYCGPRAIDTKVDLPYATIGNTKRFRKEVPIYHGELAYLILRVSNALVVYSNIKLIRINPATNVDIIEGLVDSVSITNGSANARQSLALPPAQYALSGSMQKVREPSWAVGSGSGTIQADIYLAPGLTSDGHSCVKPVAADTVDRYCRTHGVDTNRPETNTQFSLLNGETITFLLTAIDATVNFSNVRLVAAAPTVTPIPPTSTPPLLPPASPTATGTQPPSVTSTPTPTNTPTPLPTLTPTQPPVGTSPTVTSAPPASPTITGTQPTVTTPPGQPTIPPAPSLTSTPIPTNPPVTGPQPSVTTTPTGSAPSPTAPVSTITLPPGILGDGDLNGCIDLRDFTIWLAVYRGASPLANTNPNLNRDSANTIDLLDYNAWLTQYNRDNGALRCPGS